MKRVQRSGFFPAMLLSLLMLASNASADDAMPLRGAVYEKGTGNPLAGITVKAEGIDGAETLSAADGSFELKLPPAEAHSITAGGPGYQKSAVQAAPRNGSEPMRFYLVPLPTMGEVVVNADRNPDRTGKMMVSGKEMRSVPGTGGDPLRGVQALPGITTASDASAKPAIRGSGPNDNLYYVDFLPVGYLFHMGGMVSAVNANLVDDFNIYTAAWGPEYGNATGGVIDVRLREPRKDRIGVKTSVSMLEADVLLEGPVNGTQGFYVSARRSYVDLFMNNMAAKDGVKFTSFPQYWDYQAKYLVALGGADTLSIQALGSGDKMGLTIDGTNKQAQNDPGLVGDISAEMFSHSFGAVLTNGFGEAGTNRLGAAYYTTGMRSQLSQLGTADVRIDSYYLRDQFDWHAAPAHDVTLGLEYGETAVTPDLDFNDAPQSDFATPPDWTSGTRKQYKEKLLPKGASASVKDRWRALENTVIVLGLHGSDDTYLKERHLEPRAAIEYSLTPETLLTAGWGRYHQMPEGVQMIKVFGNPEIDSFRADHYVLGCEQKWSGGWSTKTETYYKSLGGLVVPHATLNYVNGGSGKAYGLELLIRKAKTDLWEGWLSFGWSRTQRRNDLTGEEFMYPTDQPVIVNAVYSYMLTEDWKLGVKWRYQTGQPFTPVVGTYTDTTGRVRPVYGALGSERLPDYHRLDLRLEKAVLYNTWKASYFIEVINAYDRRNVSGYQYYDNYTAREPVHQLTLLPSLGMEAEF